MKIPKLVIALYFITILFSCERKDLEPDEFKDIVQITNYIINCTPKVCYVQFTDGLGKIESVSWDYISSDDHVYQVLNFPDSLKMQGQKVKMRLRTPNLNELPSCYNGEMPILNVSTSFAEAVRRD